MSDLQRNAILAMGLDEEEAIHLIQGTMTALGHSEMKTRVESPKDTFGIAWHNRTPSSALRSMTDLVQERTGYDERQAMSAVIAELEDLRDFTKENGKEAGLDRIGNQGDPDGMFSKINAWYGSGSKLEDKPYIGYAESKTILDYSREDIIDRVYRKQLNNDRQAENELSNQQIKNLRDMFKVRSDIGAQKLQAANDKNIREIDSVRKSIQLYKSSAKANRGLSERREALTSRVNSSVLKGEKAIESKAHQSRFRNFWDSNEGQERRNAIIKQGAMMSLGARRLSGMTTREEPTKLDFKAAESSLNIQLKKGKFSRISGIKAIHDSRKIGMAQHYAKQGKSKEEAAQLLRSTPQINAVYQELTGRKITAKEANDLLLRDSDKIAKRMVNPEDKKVAQDLHSEMSKAADQSKSDFESGKSIKFVPELNPGLVRSEDTERAQGQNEQYNRFNYIKTEKPLNKDLDDQLEPEKQKLTETLKEKKVEADKDYGFMDQVSRRYEERNEANRRDLDKPLDEEAELRKEQREKRESQQQILRSQERDKDKDKGRDDFDR